MSKRLSVRKEVGLLPVPSLPNSMVSDEGRDMVIK